ncbi:hypothetical protein CO614_09120 [Lysobacteraceae bacterium NML120232]|nr:hypothetical protein CO614_09120 [Xanthomonadaceae bacterium NML120232]
MTGGLASMFKVFWVSALCLLACGDVYAMRCTQASYKELAEGNYFSAYMALHRQASASNEKNGFAVQMKCQAGAFISVLEPDCVEVDSPFDWDGIEYVDAVSEIVKKARDKRLVILNEAHDLPLHRAFAYQLAMALRNEGYEYLALEALSNSGKHTPEESSAGGVFLRNRGYYTAEPVFADFVRRAEEAGYKTFAYEQLREQDISGTIDEREEAQALNLSKIIESLPEDAKMMVYVGYSHAAKMPLKRSSGGETRWMAARLWEKTGIEPLSIDQASMGSGRFPVVDGIAGSFVLKKDGKPHVFGPYDGAVDFQVLHSYQSREQWLEMLMARWPFKIPEALLPATGKWNVQAFIEGEQANGVPLDQVVVDSSGGLLMLDKRRKYTFRLEQESNLARLCSID